MFVFIDGKREKIAGDAKTAGELLAAAGLSREEALVKLGGKVVHEGAAVKKGMKVEIIRVVFGG